MRQLRRTLVDQVDPRDEAPSEDREAVQCAVLVLKARRRRGRRQERDDAACGGRVRMNRAERPIVLAAERLSLNGRAGEPVLWLELKEVGRVCLTVRVEPVETSRRKHAQRVLIGGERREAHLTAAQLTPDVLTVSNRVERLVWIRPGSEELLQRGVVDVAATNFLAQVDDGGGVPEAIHRARERVIVVRDAAFADA